MVKPLSFWVKGIDCVGPHHGQTIQSLFNFLEQKITHKNIVYKLAKQGSQGLYIAMKGHYRDIYLYNNRVIVFK